MLRNWAHKVQANSRPPFRRSRLALTAVLKASAKLTLLSGTEKQEVELKPVGDKLEASGSFKVGPGTKAVAVVTVGGKPATARFTMK